MNKFAQALPQPPEELSSQTKIASLAVDTESLVQRIAPSIVTIRVKDRDGGQLSIGTGFVVEAAGLIATNYHVLAEGREFSVELSSKEVLKVVSVEATEIADDLAIIRVEPPVSGLSVLSLAEDDDVQQGTSVFAFGHPLGLEHSVVRGMVSAIRELQGQRRIQLAMQVEPGNSGGPLVDEDGKVIGIVNMKSLQTDNLGFAVPIAGIRSLLKSPNPMLIEHWVGSATMDEQDWTIVGGADWKERSGRITARGLGKGFGGRSLCLSTKQLESPFEVSVQVKLDDESGAAGLVFHSDKKDRHYGFYPSNGNLRLTCFQGPMVDRWQIIEEISTRHYKPGQWNDLKVNVTRDKIQCSVNGHIVIESTDPLLSSGYVGLAKFRNTLAEFKRFRVGTPSDEVTKIGLNEELLESIIGSSSDYSDSENQLKAIAAAGPLLVDALTQRSEKLQQEVQRLERLARDVAIAPALSHLSSLFDNADADDLCRGAFWIAALDNPDLDVESYMRKLDSMASKIATNFAHDASPLDRIAALNQYLFVENGFHGSRQEYYHRANSHLDRVIDDREGIPITLAILYIDLARRIQVDLVGIGLPGHFVVGLQEKDPEKIQLIDVFNRAKLISRREGEIMVMDQLQRKSVEADFQPQTTRSILVRVLRNLIGIAQKSRDDEAMVRYTSALAALEKEEPQHRMLRCIARYRTGRLQLALEDLKWLRGKELTELGVDELERLAAAIEKEMEK